jgi:hypothetical protein
MIVIFLDADGNFTGSAPVNTPLPLGITYANDRIHVTDETWARVQSCTWSGPMPDIRTLKDATGALIYGIADLLAHRNKLLRVTDWAGSASPTATNAAATEAVRATLRSLPATVALSPAAVRFPRLNSWDFDNILAPTFSLTLVT